jgi:hypothetical protein
VIYQILFYAHLSDLPDPTVALRANPPADPLPSHQECGVPIMNRPETRTNARWSFSDQYVLEQGVAFVLVLV